ncbi:hypothetical protein M3223_17525 [Paenibacillus pasadenensis]|uniref:hypothetical protein n=1 Tax=Paenibacillus pasadenensis TaxID=217090 RepID=UPI00203E10C1|nr:hypothetical protein [Paenibacillus pasadenensis]MCM3749161.1 hypothetical protein [Paenibacillus pasadenensis]
MNNNQQRSSEKPLVKVLEVRQVLEQLGFDPDLALKEIFAERFAESEEIEPPKKR